MRGRVTMTPRMITIMVRAPESISDETATKIIHHVALSFLVPAIGGDEASFVSDCKTIPENEDRFFRKHSFEEKTDGI